ncbi:MAG: hypothetical protein M1834_009342 [Cirrosporium novae-zelandiae]|nr:MAG: hypothetical protein M1834_009342 [Cirrosporium novae-zelandiae]
MDPSQTKNPCPAKRARIDPGPSILRRSSSASLVSTPSSSAATETTSQRLSRVRQARLEWAPRRAYPRVYLELADSPTEDEDVEMTDDSPPRSPIAVSSRSQSSSSSFFKSSSSYSSSSSSSSSSPVSLRTRSRSRSPYKASSSSNLSSQTQTAAAKHVSFSPETQTQDFLPWMERNEFARSTEHANRSQFRAEQSEDRLETRSLNRYLGDIILVYPPRALRKLSEEQLQDRFRKAESKLAQIQEEFEETYTGERDLVYRQYERKKRGVRITLDGILAEVARRVRRSPSDFIEDQEESDRSQSVRVAWDVLHSA